MPALGMAQDTGKLIRWLKKEGEQVTKGELLIEIETDKATVEVEAAASGILANVTAREGDTIPVAQVIALILAPGEPAAHSVSHSQNGAPSRAAPSSPIALKLAEEHHIDIGQIKPANGARITKSDVLAFVNARATAPRPDNGGLLIPASPKARRLAGERGIDLAALRGSGPVGAIIAADVMNAAGQPVVPQAAGQGTEVSRAWRAMAERLSAAWPTVPHFYLTRDVEATRLVASRKTAQEKHGQSITYTDLLIKAVAATLSKHPRINSAWNGHGITHNQEINVGLAVAIEDGLVVPVIHQADRLGVDQISALRCQLVERANMGKLRLDELLGGTFTISNLGMYGMDAFNAIINPPEAAILAVGRIADRVVAVAGQPAVRSMLTLTLSCDHRVIDGARGAQFLDTLAFILEESLALLD